jgi:hypothetical protein
MREDRARSVEIVEGELDHEALGFTDAQPPGRVRIVPIEDEIEEVST